MIKLSIIIKLLSVFLCKKIIKMNENDTTTILWLLYILYIFSFYFYLSSLKEKPDFSSNGFEKINKHSIYRCLVLVHQNISFYYENERKCQLFLKQDNKSKYEGVKKKRTQPLNTVMWDWAGYSGSAWNIPHFTLHVSSIALFWLKPASVKYHVTAL